MCAGSGVPRVSSAREPMLASPPPPRVSAPPPLGGAPFGKTKPFGPRTKIDKQTKKKKKKDKKTPLMHRERGALDSAAFKISPYKLGGRPLQGLRPGFMPPLPPPPPPRYATVCGYIPHYVRYLLLVCLSLFHSLCLPYRYWPHRNPF